MPEPSPFGSTGGGLYTGLMRGGIGFAFAAAASSTSNLAPALVEAVEEEVAEVPQPQEPAPQEAAEVEVLQPPAQALVVLTQPGFWRTDPRSPSGAPSAAPSEGWRT